MGMKRLFSIVMVGALTAAIPVFAQQKQQSQQSPAHSMAPFAPGSPDNPETAAPQAQAKQTWGAGMTCDKGKCKPSKTGASQSSDGYPSFPSSALAPDAPEASSAQQNPFPEAQSEAAQKKAQQGAPQPPPSAEPSSSSDQRLPGINALGNGSTLRADDGTGKPVFNPGLAAKDNKVGSFYLASGDYVGAYARFKEATQVDPKSAEAVFGLAEAADRMGRKTEAIQNFEIYLDAVHKGHDAKVARKALKRLTAHQ
jgi:tetratricopeptide (TPR) repeat protein